MNQRNETIDILKGIGIILVIIGHMHTVPIILRTIIFSFHMPLFFLVAGYFFKPNFDFKDKTKKDFSRLVVPYIFTAFILLLYNIFQAFVGEDRNLGIITKGLIAAIYGSGARHSSLLWGDMPVIGAIWFLLALFWCRVVYNIIACKTRHKYIVAGVVSVIATLADRYLISLPFTILPGLSAMMFYLIGDWLRNHKLSKVIIMVCLTCWVISIIYSHV